MTLEISVGESITVLDRIGEAVLTLIKKIIQLFTEPDEPVTEPEANNDDNKSPPTLGVNVSEDVGTGEAIGG